VSGRVCYVQRDERGSRIRSARFLSETQDERWSPPDDGATVESLREQLQQAGEWLRDMLANDRPPKDVIEVLCVDVDGALCAWLSAPSADPQVIDAVARRHAEPESDGYEQVAPAGGGLTLGPDAGTPGAATLQALALPENGSKGGRFIGKRDGGQLTAAPKRLAVVALPDAVMRLMLDALDTVGIQAETVVSLWHALAIAWDPGAKSSAPTTDDARLDATSASTTAVVMLDPLGRLVWAWSERGSLLASGSMRLARRSNAVHSTNEDDEPQFAQRLSVSSQDVARLSSDWLSWTPQLGTAPDRIIVVCPTKLDESADALTPPRFGETLTSAWPGTSIDFVLDDDPVGVTLERLARAHTGASAQTDPRRELVSLTNRPGRVHRAMYRWAAAALIVLAVVMLVASFVFNSSASEAEQAADAFAEEWRTIARETLNLRSEAPVSAEAILRLQSEVRNLRKETDEPDVPTAVPVLAELENIALIVGNEYVEVKDISAGQISVTVRATVADLSTYEWLNNALNNIAGSRVRSWQPNYRELPDKRIDCTFTGLYRNAR